MCEYETKREREREQVGGKVGTNTEQPYKIKRAKVHSNVFLLYYVRVVFSAVSYTFSLLFDLHIDVQTTCSQNCPRQS